MKGVIKMSNLMGCREYSFEPAEGPLPSVTERGEIGVEVSLSTGKIRFALDSCAEPNYYMLCGVEVDKEIRGKGYLFQGFSELLEWARERKMSIIPDTIDNHPRVISVWKRIYFEGRYAWHCPDCGDDYYAPGICDFCKRKVE